MRSGSSSTNSRSSYDTRRYRRLAPTSRVDETLFASPKPVSAQSEQRGKKQPQKNQEGEIIQIVTKDFIRNLRIPFKDPSGQSFILPSAKFEQLTSSPRVLTKEEREALREAEQRKKDEKIRLAVEWKRQINEADQSRKENPALTELELEARDREQSLVERASALRMEQEDDIKTVNKLILDAQCQAIRDAQILEKKQIQAELLEEEKRLDTMMEVERRKALETVERNDELRKQQRVEGMQKIHDQIQQHMEAKQWEDEKRVMKRLQIRETKEKMNLEDLKALETKREKQQRMQEEIMRINAETMRAKEQRREEEKLADLRDLEYRRNKMQREAEYEAEQRQIKKEKELEIARLRARQERAKDYKAEQDELRARRNQEATEREWRRKEKELREKKAQEKEMLRAAREEQIHCKEHLLSMEAGRKKAEFERVLKVQQEEIIKLKEEEEKKRQKAERHSEAIRSQVKERVLSAVTKRAEIFKEADRLTEEARQRQARLNKIKEEKLKELRDTGLSEKYCSEVERKVRACERESRGAKRHTLHV